jgi:aminoglycoside phosphotransferase (APT) family kinase protein
LILECLPNAEDLHAYHVRSGRFPDRLATALGTGLASLHRCTRRLATTRRDESPKLVRPTVFGLAAPRIEVLREASAVNLNVIRTVQKHPLFLQEFARLSSEWRTDSLIHGDVKLANCLTHRSSSKGHLRGVKWIDWEFAGLGDPRWDVGSVFTSYLALWVFSIPIPRSDKPELLLDSARISLAKVQRNLRCFIRSYLDAAALETPSVRAWISSCVRMAGARLVQTAYEFAAGASELTAPVLTLLQMALNVLERPERAAIDLLGLDEQSLAARAAPEVGPA